MLIYTVEKLLSDNNESIYLMFESQYQHILFVNIFYMLHGKDENKEKSGQGWPIV